MCARRTLLLTGSSRGIGRSICEMLLQHGHTVLGVSRNPEFNNAPQNYVPIALDLSQLERLDARLRLTMKKYPLVDAVISNAGGPVFGNLEQLSADQVRRGIELNLTSHLLVARAALPFLKRHDSADVILMGSEAALRGSKRGSIYCAAKFGLRGFAQSLRQECAASGVRVTIIHPGMVRTSFFDSLDFEPGGTDHNVVEPADVTAAVKLVLDARPGTVFEELSVSPLKKVVRNKSEPKGKI